VRIPSVPVTCMPMDFAWYLAFMSSRIIHPAFYESLFSLLIQPGKKLLFLCYGLQK
jgi:hypothetical protein